MIVPSARILYPRPPTLLCGRADNACTNLLGYLVRYVRTRGSMRLWEAQNRRLSIYPLLHALATHYFLRLTRARRRWFGRRTARVLPADFWYFSSQKSTIKEKLLYDSIRRQQATALRTKPKHNQQTKQKICFPSRQRRYQTHARPPYYAGVQQCVHESARLSRAICSHAW